MDREDRENPEGLGITFKTVLELASFTWVFNARLIIPRLAAVRFADKELVELLFPGVTERWVTNVVSQACRGDSILISDQMEIIARRKELAVNGTANLLNLQ
jgi:hypothetical protein